MRPAALKAIRGIESLAVFAAGAWVTTLVANQEPHRVMLDPETKVLVPRRNVLLGGAVGLAIYRRFRQRHH